MDTNSIWQNSKSIPFQVLKNNENCEVCIVGAGIAGSSIAYELLQQGKSIIILDRDYSMKSETALTSAHLSNALDDGYASIERLLGLKSAKIAAKSHTEAIKRIEKTIKQEGIACEFRWLKGYLVTGKT
jgi:glycine/D-amino acid oxidase-like deaminating enzyme